MEHVLSYRVGTLRRPNLPFARLAALGVGGVELAWDDQTTVEAVRAAVAPAHLRVTSIQAPASLQDADFAARLRSYAAAAAALGAGYLFVSVRAGELPLPQAYARLREGGDVVGAHGVYLALETHPDLCQNASSMLATMAGVEHPWIGVNFDTANIYYYNERIDGTAELRAVARHVRGVHLKDTMGGFHDGDFPVFGAGIVDFAAVGSALDAAGYRGPYCMELEGRNFDPGRPEELAAKVGRCVAHLRSVGLIR